MERKNGLSASLIPINFLKGKIFSLPISKMPVYAKNYVCKMNLLNKLEICSIVCYISDIVIRK